MSNYRFYHACSPRNNRLQNVQNAKKLTVVYIQNIIAKLNKIKPLVKLKHDKSVSYRKRITRQPIPSILGINYWHKKLDTYFALHCENKMTIVQLNNTATCLKQKSVNVVSR